MIMLRAAVFHTFSLIVAYIVKTRERFMGIGQVLTMPLFFASDAIYPVALMPGWLQHVAAFSPLTYQVDALRSLKVGSVPGAPSLALDFGIQLAALVLLTGVATRLYPRIVD